MSSRISDLMDEIDAIVNTISKIDPDLARELYSALSDEDYVERTEAKLTVVLKNLRRYAVLDLLAEG